jgi:hypothetical protein
MHPFGKVSFLHLSFPPHRDSCPPFLSVIRPPRPTLASLPFSPEPVVSMCSSYPRTQPLKGPSTYSSIGAHSHFHEAHKSPLASPVTTSTATRAHLGPLDLAPSKIQPKSPSPSPCASPHRPPLPLTPPLTPSSLNDSASQGGFPATPTDIDSTNAALWRRKSKYLAQKGLPISGPDDFVGDVPSTDRPYLPLAQSQQPESNSSLSRYLRFDTPPSRFLLVSDVVGL